MTTLRQGFRLDGVRVEPPTGAVTGPGGSERLDPKVMDVLVLMAGRAGEVVSREDLLTQLWPHVVVTDDALTRCFYELRRQLSHAGGDERYRALIETVPKRGYRLNAAVAPLEAPPAAVANAPPRRAMSRWVALGAAGALLAAGIGFLFWRGIADRPAAPSGPPAIAVLPFLDMSAEKDQGYFSDGMTEEILNKLSQAENLRVISRTSSFALRNETIDVPGIAERLGVDYVLEGSVRKSGGRVRITAQLIDSSTNSHAWSQTYDRALDDLFAVQDEIAASVAAALQVELAGNSPGGRMPPRLDAYERYLQGEFFYNRRSPGDVERALTQFKEAVALDPGYARAWAALAGVYSLQIGQMDKATAAPLRALQGEAARRAVELDPNLTVAQARLAQYLYQSGQFAQGDEHRRIAIALDPNDPLVLGFNASEAIWKGDYARALRLWRQAAAQDPLSAVSRANLGYMLMLNGHLDEALAENRKALELNPDAEPRLRVDIARILIMQGRYDEAISVIGQLPPGNERDYAVALLHRAPGKRQDADAAFERLEKAATDIPGVVHLADVYVDRGRRDAAFELLSRHYREIERDRDARPRALWYFQDELRISPYLKALHADPRWAEITRVPD
jgi:TolB-like protein/DNA-binding winged helix-turn-helix (wHTH) protein/Tfp pilus assembly protein PilF